MTSPLKATADQRSLASIGTRSVNAFALLVSISFLISTIATNRAFSSDTREIIEQRTTCALKARTRPLPTDGSPFHIRAWVYDPKTLAHVVGKIGDSGQRSIRLSSDGGWTIECKETELPPPALRRGLVLEQGYEQCVEDRKVFDCLVQDFGWTKKVDEDNRAVVFPPK